MKTFDSPFDDDDVHLYFCEGTSDKYYRVRVIKEMNVNGDVFFRPSCEYGPRNKPNVTDFYKPEWVTGDPATAQKQALKILTGKIKGGYTTHPSGDPSRSLDDMARIEAWKLSKKHIKSARTVERRGL